MCNLLELTINTISVCALFLQFVAQNRDTSTVLSNGACGIIKLIQTNYIYSYADWVRLVLFLG